jgi:hypothetical protein
MSDDSASAMHRCNTPEELQQREHVLARLVRESTDSELASWQSELYDGGGKSVAANAADDAELESPALVSGPIFSPEFYIRSFDVLPPWHRRQMLRLYKPRFVGTVRNGGAHPVSLEPAVGWVPFGKQLSDGTVLAQPRLAFVKGWGSPISRLYGTCLVTHFRRGRLGIAYVAVQRIEPASDPGSSATGVSGNCFEELGRNIAFIPAAVGSVDLTGSVLTLADGTPAEQLSLMMHYNDDGNYSLQVITVEQIDRWQQLATDTLEPNSDAAAAAADDDEQRTDARQRAQAKLRYVQVIRALQMARASSTTFGDLAVSSGLRALMQEQVSLPEADDAYLPHYGPESNDRQIGSLKSFTLANEYY